MTTVTNNKKNYFSLLTKCVDRGFCLRSIVAWIISSQTYYWMDLFFQIYFSFDLPFFWLVFCSESLEQLDEYKKDFLFFVDKMCWIEMCFFRFLHPSHFKGGQALE
ncbi:uncharacterized protein LOC114166485 isoform X3 [Vigna unguiculata]|uniref:uncharacterized protein LOC114166485 isoform X3 n=1 Tax=Vigna unguiculata TaxID=3917 RepID=UPI001016DA03|nr:uncharacterized protein LOC114166485 isoform X3 [Vigna unguiculata]